MEISSKSQAENGTDNNTIMTPLRVRQSIAANTGGGTASDYSSLVNKPQINSITLDGNKTGTQLGLASSSDIPTKTSDLQNDTGYITGMTVLTYGSSTWQNFLDAYNANRVVYCKASSGSNPGSGSKTRRAFLAYVNNETNPTEVEFQYYRSVSSHSMAQQGDQVFVYKLTNRGVWSVTTREASSKVVAGTGLSSTYSGGTLTLSTSFSNNYSTSETTVGTWVDGKTLYRKCVAITLPNNAQVSVATGLSGVNVVRVDGYVSNGTVTVPLVYNNLLYSGGTYAYYDSDNVYIGCNFDGSAYSGYAILEYTKN